MEKTVEEIKIENLEKQVGELKKQVKELETDLKKKYDDLLNKIINNNSSVNSASGTPCGIRGYYGY